MKLKLHVWRQKDRNSPGQMVSYDADHVSPDMSFLEMLDVVNQDLINKGDEPITSTTIVAKVSVVCARW